MRTVFGMSGSFGWVILKCLFKSIPLQCFDAIIARLFLLFGSVKRCPIPQIDTKSFGQIFLLNRDRKDHDSQTWQDSKLFSLPGKRAIFCTFWGCFLTNCRENLERKGEKTLEKIQKKIQWRRRPEIADFFPLSWSNVSWWKIYGAKKKSKKQFPENEMVKWNPGRLHGKFIVPTSI